LSRFDQSNLRAILLPKPESALYSTRLKENNGVVYPVADSMPLPSPYSSSSEDEGSTTLTQVTITQRRSRSQAAIIFEQSGDKERFTLGGSLDNDMVLNHPNHTAEDRCYINLVHVQLYPDPDQDTTIVSVVEVALISEAAQRSRTSTHLVRRKAIASLLIRLQATAGICSGVKSILRDSRTFDEDAAFLCSPS
jgi:hypothetical protein